VRTITLQGETSSIIALVELLSADGRSPSAYVQRDEAMDAVHAAMRDLPDEYRQAVQLRFLEGMNLDEVAAIMNRSPRAVQGIVDRAKKMMRESLERLSL
jgi:RNA polymerase sigma-70 factor (ECF subfamily)